MGGGSFRNRGVLSALGLAVLIPCASPALGSYTQVLGVPHVNLFEQTVMSSSATASLMTLRYEEQSDVLQLETVFDFGRSVDPSFLPVEEMNEDMVAAALNHFESRTDFHYVAIRATTFLEAARQAAEAIARVYPGGTPGSLPVLIPLNGGYTHWVVGTGVAAESDPSVDPGTALYGFWLDDPTAPDLDPEGNPVETAMFYSVDPGAPQLQGIWQSMPSGYYVAVVPVREPTLMHFDGFYEPVDSAAVNEAKAGQSIPFRWRLTDANGDPIADPASFSGLRSYPLNCSSLQGGGSDAIEEYAPGNSGLRYDGDGYWQFTWKTPKRYAFGCRAVFVQFNNTQTSPTVAFRFR